MTLFDEQTKNKIKKAAVVQNKFKEEAMEIKYALGA